MIAYLTINSDLSTKPPHPNMIAFPTPALTALQPPFAVVSQEITPATLADEVPHSALAADAEAGQGQLQIGDFTLGDMDCPSLTGHPDIRY
jgi:hypothetical protein